MVIGAVPAKSLCALIMAAEAGLAQHIPGKPWLVPFCAGGAVFFTLDALFGWKARPYGTPIIKLFFLGWNAFLVAEVAFSWAVWRGLVTWPRL